MMRKQFPLAFALVFIASSLGAQTTVWQIDPAHTNSQFAVRHMMVSTVRGQFNKTTGTVTWDGKNLSSAVVDAVIDATSIDTRVEQRDNHLKSPDFLDVANFPTLTFKSTKIEAAGLGKARMTGDLTIHGVTRPVVFEVEGPSAPVKDPGGVRVGASATTKISRKDFGLTWNRAVEAGGVVVGDEVTITIDVELVNRAR